ncbi:MAG: hypothetical protein ACOVKJ_04220, partial [Flavobacterium sp.]
LKQFEFLNGSFSFLILACQIQWSEKSSVVLLCVLEFGISKIGISRIRAFVAKNFPLLALSQQPFLVYSSN